MRFEEVLGDLLRGQKVRRAEWAEWCFLIMDGKDLVRRKDLLADDWEVIQSPCLANEPWKARPPANPSIPVQLTNKERFKELEKTCDVQSITIGRMQCELVELRGDVGEFRADKHVLSDVLKELADIRSQVLAIEKGRT